ncbi:MAG: hypothetical protein KGD63_02020, partial [Candidatus Lokiarchaeota archaeon]|nr:hypothetical protein [Candidatus Lokiarchaeota archaeon]
MNKSRRKLVLILFITFIFLNIFITLRNNNLNNPNDTKNNEFSSFRLKNSAYNFTGTIVLTNNSTDNSEYPSMVIDNLGNIHIAWQESNESDSGDTDIFYKKWNSTTEEWSLPEIVSNISTSYGRYPVITIDNTYNIHIAWIDRTNYNGCGSDNDVFYSKKNSATEEWTLTEVITTYSDNETADASIAVDNSGNVHIAFREWMNYLSSGFDRDLYYVQWNNNTETWIPIELVSSESDDHSYGPSLAIDASGDLNIVWYDFADYDGSGNDLDIFYKQRNNISGIWTSTDVVSTQSGAYSKNP